MDDTISRQAAIDALAKVMPTPTTPDGSSEFDHEIFIADEAFADAIQIINDLPHVEPERKKGKWIVTSKFEYCCYAKCNECKVTQVFYYNKVPNFCPNCGTEMENGNG